MFYETLFIGLVAAVIFTELTDVYPGGIIVPADIALFLDRPIRILITVLIAFISLYLYKLISRYVILYGKRRFVLLVLLAGVLTQLWLLLFPHFFPAALEFRAIGWIIPGLLANNLEKQKKIPTLAALFTVAVITYFLARLLMMLSS